jgi:uncharacterized low-complexity protein
MLSTSIRHVGAALLAGATLLTVAAQTSYAVDQSSSAADQRIAAKRSPGGCDCGATTG